MKLGEAEAWEPPPPPGTQGFCLLASREWVCQQVSGGMAADLSWRTTMEEEAEKASSWDAEAEGGRRLGP